MDRFSRRTALALAAGVVITACGGGDDDSGGGTTGPPDTSGGSGPAGTSPTTSGDTTPGTTPGTGSTPTSSPTSDDVPDISEYDLDATYRYMYSVGPSRFDPHMATSSFDNASLALVYDRIVHLSPSAAPVPGIATEWTFSEDGSTLDFTIRDGVLFHDGTPCDAAAVAANLERAKTKEGSAVASDFEVVEAIEAVEANVVRLTLNGPGAQLPLVLSDRAGMLISPAKFDDPNLDQAPAGAGMFRVTEYRPNDRIVLERFEDYWEPDAVRCSGFEFVINGDPITRLNAIRTGQVDGTFVDPPQEAEAEAAGLVIRRGTGLGFYHLQLNRSFEAFASLEVRQALNHAIDKQAIVDGLLEGLGNASAQSFPEGYFAFDEETGTETYPYDVERAKELLAEAGYADGFEFETIVPTIPQILQLGAIIQDQLRGVGLTMNIRQVEPAQTADIFYARKEGDALVSPWGGRADPTQTLRLMYTSDGFSNPGGHSTPEVEAAVAETEKVQSDDDRALALQAASAAVTTAALDVVTHYPVTPGVYTEEVLGIQTWVSGKPEFRYVGLRAG